MEPRVLAAAACGVCVAAAATAYTYLNTSDIHEEHEEG